MKRKVYPNSDLGWFQDMPLTLAEKRLAHTLYSYLNAEDKQLRKAVSLALRRQLLAVKKERDTQGWWVTQIGRVKYLFGHGDDQLHSAKRVHINNRADRQVWCSVCTVLIYNTMTGPIMSCLTMKELV